MPRKQRPKIAKNPAPPGGWTEEEVALRAGRYRTRNDFQYGVDSPAYQAAFRRKILDRVCAHMEPQRRRLTKSFCQSVALKHRTRTTFAHADPPPYNKACQKGWLDEICAHMDPVPQRWTEERILEAAAKCASREEFKKTCGGAAYAARNLGIYGLVEDILESLRVPWTEERLMRVAGAYPTRKSFQVGCPGGYIAARRLGIENAVFAHMAPPPVRRSEAELREALARHASPSQLMTLEPEVYRSAQERGLLKEAYETGAFDREAIFEAASECASVGEFYNLYRPEYLCAREGGFLDEVLEDLGPSVEYLQDKADQCRGREEFRMRFLAEYRNAAKRDLLPVLFEGRELWQVWEKEAVLRIARRFGSPAAFAVAEPNAYAAAHYNGWADEAQAHMSRSYQDWTREAVVAEIEASSSRTEFQRRVPGAYAWARRNECLEELTRELPTHGVIDPETPTQVYMHRLGRRIYVGISVDPDYRKGLHEETSHQVVVDLVRTGEMEVFSRPGKNGVARPVTMPRFVARRLERRLIHRFVRAGWEVTNKAHNPQYDYISRTWSWEAGMRAQHFALPETAQRGDGCNAEREAEPGT